MTQATALHEAVAQRPALLVVDDDQGTRALSAPALSLSGCRVSCAEELQETGAILEFRKDDARCVDLVLRSLSGLDGLDSVGQAHHRWPGLDIVVQTGNDDAGVPQACLMRGAHAVLIEGQPFAARNHHRLQSPLREVASC
jgi:DNA-binding NtrC family response regulator